MIEIISPMFIENKVIEITLESVINERNAKVKKKR